MSVKVGGRLAGFLTLVVMLGALFIPQAFALEYEVGTSTPYSGSKPIAVVKAYSDVPEDHWFYEGLQYYRKLGVVQGDQYANISLDRVATASEVYAFFVRYIYSDSFEGQEINGAIYGDYTFNGKAAWLDAYDTVTNALKDTIEKMGHEVSLPGGTDATITRKQSFVLYAMAVLSRVKDPVWYFGQFSSEHLGYFARSNAPLTNYRTGNPVVKCFSPYDHYSMTPLEIQSANMLMYLGILEGNQFQTLAPNQTINRASAVKLLQSMDYADASPHKDEEAPKHSGGGGGGGSLPDWGGNPDDHPKPPDPPAPPVEEGPNESGEHKQVPLVLVDWDNNIIGTIPVYTNTDLREQVDSYVRRKLVHPDLVVRDYRSTARQDTYRGRYLGTVEDEQYPLTSHLDYAFMVRRLAYQDNGWRLFDTDYPYAYGWVETDIKNYKDCESVLGVGSYTDWDGACTYKPINLAQPKKGITGSNIVWKAVYQPCPSLLEAGKYHMIEEPVYVSHTAKKKPKDEPVLYMEERKERDPRDVFWDSVRPEWGDAFQSHIIYVYTKWERVDWDVFGNPHGVPICVKPTYDMYIHNDMSQATQNTVLPFKDYNSQTVFTYDDSLPDGNWLSDARYGCHSNPWWQGKSLDRWEQEFTIMANYHDVEWQLKDEFKSNFVVGKEMSPMYYSLPNVNIPAPIHEDKNHNYTVIPNTDWWVPKSIYDGNGTYGFVYNASCNGLALTIDGGVEDRGYMRYYLLGMGASGVNSWEFSELCTEYITKAFADVRANHYREEGWWNFDVDTPAITYHQLMFAYQDWLAAGGYGGVPADYKVKWLSVTEAESMPIATCKLHKSCRGE